MDIYLILVIILFALAASDLIVGVSNDAVNFLNSAIGAKAGSRILILIVASLGILCGALFSSGMMEVARKGIFNPEMFSFAQVMIIFMAVMLTDILLLDLFNTFGLPTSTTVSIVFELLGAATVVSLLHVHSLDLPLGEAVAYINTSKATLIILGIFLSIIIAFGIGAIAQFISRMLFSFDFQSRLNRVGPFWGGAAMTIMSHFLIIKGLKGSALVPPQMMTWIQNHTLLLLVGVLLFWICIMYVFIRFTRIRILRLIVLAGTFSLAMAFANNDLVNFIGVPIAGFESFLSWKDAGTAADVLLMTSLKEAVKTPTYLLMIAGVIMMVTLWRSKKARSVTATQINLSRQREGYERFKPHLLAHLIVRLFTWTGRGLHSLVPPGFKKKMEYNYQQSKITNDPDPPAFDMVRAAVNLTIASMLIAVATSYKLPLSTTYVSFMVAMGTSLADKAWGKGSATYRVAGVINVILGWFMTAVIAFTVSGIMAFVLTTLGMKGLIILITLLVIVVISSLKLHKRISTTQGKLGAEGEPLGSA